MGRRSEFDDGHAEPDARVTAMIAAWKDEMNRRRFVRTAGGILVASGLGCVNPMGEAANGFISIAVGGLTPGAPDAGSVTVTPSSGGAPMTFTIPADGVVQAEVPADTYSVSYTAPAGYVLSAGTVVPATITVDSGKTTTISLGLEAVATSGTLQISVGGLVAGATGGGTAVVTPSGGGAGITINVGANGTGSAQFATGTYTVVYTPPATYNLVSGATPRSVTVSANQTLVVQFTLAAQPQIGTVAISIMGLSAGAPNGGSAAVTPSAGGATVNISVASNGSGSATFPAGSYAVLYTPPAGYDASANTNPQTVSVTANQTTTVPFTVTPLVQAGNLAVTITGLNPGATSGGTIAVTPTGGGSTTTVPVPATGIVSTAFAPGSYSVSYTVPSGYFLTSGTTPQTVTITSGNSTPIVFGVTAFATPDILDNASFETDFSGFQNFSGGTPAFVTRATDFARTGLFSARFSWTPSPSDSGAEMMYAFAAQDRIWVRFYFRLTSAIIPTIWKFCRNRQTGFGTLVGGLFVEATTKIISWGFDAELSAQTTGIGLTQQMVLDGNWHSIEYDYWRNGDPSGFPSVAFWFDGNPINGSTAPSPGNWQNGRLIAGQRGSNVQIGLIQMMGTLNGGNSTTGQCNIDDVSISAAGRIGP